MSETIKVIVYPSPVTAKIVELLLASEEYEVVEEPVPVDTPSWANLFIRVEDIR
jgi:hypothetical protein